MTLILYLLNHTRGLSEITVILILIQNHSGLIVLEKRELSHLLSHYHTAELYSSGPSESIDVSFNRFFCVVMHAKCLLGLFSDVVVRSLVSALVLRH